MTIMETRRDSTEQEQTQQTEDRLVKRDGVIRSLLRGFIWPFGIVVHAYRGIWWILGVRQPEGRPSVSPTADSPARQNLAGRKRLSRVTRLLLAVLPRWVQCALGYPVSSSIGRALSPEIRGSPTKPSGKGSKRKQDELEDEDEDDNEAEEHPTWVEALSQELADDDVPEEDPDYEPSSIETESEEYRSQNNTESDIELQETGVVIIKDLKTGDEPSSTQSEVLTPAL